jgi:hypothetical protein
MQADQYERQPPVRIARIYPARADPRNSPSLPGAELRRYRDRG